MAITLQCPRCTHEQTIDDDKIGKDVPCKICHHFIKTGTGGEKPKAKLASAEKGAQPEGVKAGPPTVQSGKKTTTTVENEPKPSKKRNDREDDDEERPRTRKRPAGEGASSGGIMMVLIGGGVFLLLALVCGGGTFGMYFMFRSDGKPDDKIAQIDRPIAQEQNQRNDKPDFGPRPGPDPGPRPGPDPFPPFKDPNPFRPPPQPENLDPANPNHIDRVLTVLRGPADARPPAFTWLINADANHPRRSDVAQQLERLVDDELKRPFTKFFDAYFRWNTRDNVPSLRKFAENTAFTVWDNDRRQKSMLALGKLKELGAADSIASKLGNAFDGETANRALVEMGPGAQSVVLKYFNHPDGRVRDKARTLLQGYGAKTEVYFTQCLADLDGPDVNRRGGALQWLAKSQVDDKRKSEVAKALNKCLDNPDCLRNGDLVATLENWGTTENVPKLMQVLDQSKFGNAPATRILGKLRDPDGIKAVARSMANFFNQQEARNVLKACGSTAEPAVIEAMNGTNDGRARTEYVRLLGEIGTPKVGIPALQQLAFRFQQDRFLIQTIQQSQKAIFVRGK